VHTRRHLLILLIVGILGLGLAMIFSPSREPRYQDRTLSQWIQVYTSSLPQTNQEAAAAIRHIGTNALPYLVEWIRYDSIDHPWRYRFYAAFNGLVTTLKLGNSWYILDPRGIRAGLATEAFAALGPEANPVVGDLARVIREFNEFGRQQRAMDALAYIGPAGLPSLMEAVTNKALVARGHAAYSIHVLGEAARPAVPLLIGHLQDPDVGVGAAATLGLLKMEPALVVPALGENLQNSNYSARCWAAMALRHFGGEARSAVPALLQTLRDTNFVVRQEVTNALLAIDPHALEKSQEGMR
jgi:HEAT repeats